MHCNTMDNECICDLVRRIAVAQNRVAENNECCQSSCEDSIEKLLNPDRDNKNQHTTIPIMLYCKSTCNPFIGKGIKKSNSKCKDGGFYTVESSVFRVKDFIEGNSCCATLEILEPCYTDYEHGSTKQKLYRNNKHYMDNSCGKWHYNKKNIKNFIATGVCLTVDLNKFIGITCLEPITPMKM